jgi:membrane fusion protein, heavy metal efflux system
MSTRLVLNTLMLTLAIAGCDDAHHDDESGHGHHNEANDPQGDERGENNGRMLRDGSFVIELAIFETGVPPEFRAWAFADGKAVTPAEVDLRVRLIRLGGEDDIRFKPTFDYLRGDTIIYEPHSFAVELTAEYHGKSYEWTYDSFEGRTLIEPAVAESFGLSTEPVGPATIRQHVHTYGRVQVALDNERHIAARYAGQVKSVEVRIGDMVKKGQQLLAIESNDSLQTYSVTAPIGGVVTHRNVNPGEQTRNRDLLRIADYSEVWVLLDVFPADLSLVEVSQRVIVSNAEDQEIGQGRIDWMSTIKNTDQSVTARVVMQNASGNLRPGLLVQGEIEVAAFDVPLVVKRSGLQAFRDFTVVYGKFGDEYEVRMLELGREGRELVEVLGGIDPGVPYVTTNSYLVKADIEKSGASHDH